MSQPSKFCIIGIPDHQGVMNVGGRLGAARGPAAFRRIFSRFQGKGNVRALTSDLGDVLELGSDVSVNHERASSFVAASHPQHGASVIVGGGHDHGFSHLRGIYEKVKSPRYRLGCLNIDAHLDVRKPAPLISSGSPFYLALESGILHPSRFVEFGIQSHCNSPELWKYIEDKKVRVIPFQDLRRNRAVDEFRKALKKLCSMSDGVVVSLDLDAASGAFAPGVSAPQAEGFSSSEIIEMMEIAGYEKKVISLGIFELCPEHDVDHLTARLAATSAYHFIDSKAERLGQR
jgi:formimidoylglutamase